MSDEIKIELFEKVNCIELMMCDKTTKIKDGLTEYRTYTGTEKIVSIVNNNDKAARIVADKTKDIWITYENFLGIEYARVQVGCKKPTWINLTNMNFDCSVIKFKNKMSDIGSDIIDPVTGFSTVTVYLATLLLVVALALGFTVYFKNTVNNEFERVENSIEQILDNTSSDVQNMYNSLDED